MKYHIRKLIRSAIEKLYPIQKDIGFSVDYPPAGVDADYASNVAMVLAKKLGKKPMEVAEQIRNVIASLAKQSQGKKIASSPLDTLEAPRNDDPTVDIAPPGFLNFQLSERTLFKNLEEINKKPEKYGSVDIGKRQLAIVEYFQLNVAKPPHVGHLRSAVIGDSLKRILRFAGYKTVSDTHIGDWGTQFGFLLLSYKKLNGKERIKGDPLAELNELYVEINKMAESDPAIREEAKREFAKLEKGDKENRKLWKTFVKISRNVFQEMLSALRLEKFEYDLGESFYEDKMLEILKQLKQAKLLMIGKTGEQYVDLEKCGLGRLICVKSDGATTYEMRDLATLAYRYDELAKKEKAQLALNLYVVDSRQAHDFRQVFKTMELLGYDVSKSKHVEFGFMSLPEGAISTRKGNAISLEQLVAEAKKRALEVIKDKNPDLKGKEKVALEVGLAALKYGDLKHNRKSDIVFDWEESLSFEGNTGPYLQYTYARLRSILRKVNHNAPLPPLMDSTDSPQVLRGGKGRMDKELALLRKLALFPDKVADAASEFMPSVLADYLYNLGSQVNNFYHSSPVLQEKDLETRKFRLALVAAAAAVLKQGLGLLGIEAPEEM